MNFSDNEKTFFQDEQGFQSFLGIGSKKKVKKAQAEAAAAQQKASAAEAALAGLLGQSVGAGLGIVPKDVPQGTLGVSTTTPSTVTATETVMSATTVKGDGTEDVAGAGLPVQTNNTKKYLLWGGIGLAAVIVVVLLVRKKK